MRSATCPHCQRDFAVPAGPTGRRRYYCGKECAAEAKRARDRERMRTYWRERPPCHFPGCGKPIASRTLCAGHRRQARLGRPLAPLRPKALSGKRGPQASSAPLVRIDGRTCLFPDCGAPLAARGLCKRHASHRNKTSLSTAQYVAGFERCQGACDYCGEAFAARFEIDHAHDGLCRVPHKDVHMCPDCIRGYVHRQCNEELKWLERAMSAGRITAPAPRVLGYLTGRPFRD